MDPLGLIAGAKTAQEIFQLLMTIREHIPNSDIISAHFDAEGQHFSGSDKIEIERTEHDEGIWLYRVKALSGYSFQRFPLISSGILEQLGWDDENLVNPDAEIWRWIASPKPNTLVDGRYIPPNALVEFVVVGYRSSALLEYFSSIA